MLIRMFCGEKIALTVQVYHNLPDFGTGRKLLLTGFVKIGMIRLGYMQNDSIGNHQGRNVHMDKTVQTKKWWVFDSVFGALLIGSSLLLSGCGKGNDTATSTSLESGTAQNPADNGADHPAAQTVTLFLQAMLRGEDVSLRSLLTPLARERGEEQGIPFSPPASDTAVFTIDKTTLQGEIGAYVYTTLTDQDEEGESEAAEIIWIVANTEDGWRVAGAAVALFEGQEKTVINFEDPEAALQAIVQAEEKELKRQNKTLPRFGSRPQTIY